MAETTVKVTVKLSIEVDREGWELEYGRTSTARDLRADVRQYVLTATQACDLFTSVAAA